MAYEFFYEGTPYSLEPTYGESFIGYRLPAGQIGAPTSIQTANQIQEVSNLLNQGLKTIELQPINPEVFDQIPKQHFREIGRAQKLAGAETTIHAPVVEPSGLTRDGWSETDRESAERQLKMVVDKSHELNPQGNMPITIHASAIQGTEWMPTKEGPEEKRIIAINQETKQMIPIQREGRIYPHEVAGKKPEEIKPRTRTPREELEIHNEGDWHNNLTQVIFYKNRGDDIIETYYSGVKNIWPVIMSPGVSDQQKQKIIEKLPNTQKEALSRVRGAYEYVKNSQLILNSLFSKAYKYGSEKDREKLRDAATRFQEQMNTPDLSIQSDAIQNLAIQMEEVKPKLFIPIEDFAAEHSAKTFANTALHAYEKYGNKAPIISVENLFPGMAFSRSEQLKKLVDNSRKKFVEGAVEKGHSKGDAEAMAKKILGVTWDVGHINMMKKAGFKDEDIERETKEIAKYVKHVHLTDNFGYSDSHLPPGMGNVPTKKILEQLEKAGFSGKKIIEAGAFAQHFKISPTQSVLEAFGSPLYTMMAAPYWNQAMGTQGGYFSGYGPVLPEQHFSMYGAGFSGMPVELGGQVQGGQSRFSGTPNQ